MTVATKSSRFDSSLLFSVDALIEESERAAAAEVVEAPKVDQWAAELDAYNKHTARREACLEGCAQLSARAHLWITGENEPVRKALLRVLDRWYRLTGVMPFFPRRVR